LTLRSSLAFSEAGVGSGSGMVGAVVTAAGNSVVRSPSILGHSGASA
jgi:hypothetical protein